MSGDAEFKFAFSANAFLRFTVLQTVETIAEIGYPAVELMSDEPHLVPGQVEKDTLVELRKRITDLGLVVSNVNAFTMRTVGDTWHPSWIEQDEALRKIRLEHTIGSLRIAAALGAPSITTEPGGPLPEGVEREQCMAWFVEGMTAAAKVAQSEGVMLLVEPEPELLIENPDQFLQFRPQIDSPAIGLNFDIGHFYCVGVDPVEAFEKLKPHIRHAHMEDIAASREHYHLVPGEGIIPLPEIINTMRAGGYGGWISVELYPYVDRPAEVARQAFEYLQHLPSDRGE
ncbi:MAG: sugar phosphate isomerase/epimerase family protein [Phycisphaerae bacterium]|nr:sugar phosphate isomerase/epimerase family protein [Phycisphaerae bacterium]